MSIDNLEANLDLAKDYTADQQFLGTVIANVDPLGLDRVQVSVPGLYDQDEGALVWAGPKKLSSFGIGATFGVYGSPAVGAHVIVTLQNGDPHYPQYESILRQSNAEYPSGTSWGFVDPVGNKFKVDLEAKTVTLTTNDGVVFSTDGSGNLVVNVPGTTTVTSGGTITMTSDADINLSAVNFIVDADTAITGTLTNNGVNVGSTHTHSGVRSGGDTSGPPT